MPRIAYATAYEETTHGMLLKMERAIKGRHQEFVYE